MALDFRRPQRDQQFLLPPDMGEWLGPDHLVWFVIDAVDALDLSALRARSRLGGVGRAPFDPGMLLALLIYAYAHGERSSRQIERLCGTDVAFRVICGNEVPDHTTVARFRATHEESFAAVFTQVLVLCATAGLGRFGSVAVDGTKIAANASRGANRSEETLRGEAERMLREAAEVDAAEDEAFGADRRGDELPRELADPTSRAARIRECLDQIAKEKQAGNGAAQARVAKWQERIAHAEAHVEQVRAAAAQRWEAHQRGEPIGRGATPVPPEEHCRVLRARRAVKRNEARLARAIAEDVRPRDVRIASQLGNVTDPDSRLMPTRNGYLQGFNAQIVVTDDQLIIATAVNNLPGDSLAFVPMMTAAVNTATVLAEATGRDDTTIGVVLADAGYLSEANLTAPGPDRLIAIGKRRAAERAAREKPASGAPPTTADPIKIMDHRLRTEDGIKAYRRRGATVEPAIGSLKDRIRLRRFSRRGTTAAASELHLGATVHNLLKWRQATFAY
jgi:transposase